MQAAKMRPDGIEGDKGTPSSSSPFVGSLHGGVVKRSENAKMVLLVNFINDRVAKFPEIEMWQ